jgi:hypothetical protein
VASTITDEIIGKVRGVMDAAPVHQNSHTRGTVFGEADHINEEFILLMARRLIPEISLTLPSDRERVLHVEWDRTPENLDKIEKYMNTGDPEVRDALVHYNYSIAGRDMLATHAAWKELLDSAKEHGFKIKPFDEENISIDALYKQLAQELGKEVQGLTDDEIALARDRRIEQSNPVMIKNIQDNTANGAYSIVIVGDAHAKGAKDLPEALGYSYVRIKNGAEYPDISYNKDGADLIVRLVDRQMASEFMLENIRDLGVGSLPNFLEDLHVPEWCSEDNKSFLNALNGEMHTATRMIQTGQYEKAVEKIESSRQLFSERYSEQQIEGDYYYKARVDVLDAAHEVVLAEIPEAQKVLQIEQEGALNSPNVPRAAP